MNSSLSHPEPLNFGGLHGSAEKKSSLLFHGRPWNQNPWLFHPRCAMSTWVPDVTTPEMTSFTENGKLELNLCRSTFYALVRVVQTLLFLLHISSGLLDTMQIYQVVCGYFASVMSRVITSIKWPYLGGFQYFCHFHLENRGRWTHLDEHIFQRGGFTTNQSKNGICSMCGIFTTT